MGKAGFEPEFQTSQCLRPGPLDDFPNNQSQHPSECSAVASPCNQHGTGPIDLIRWGIEHQKRRLSPRGLPLVRSTCTSLSGRRINSTLSRTIPVLAVGAKFDSACSTLTAAVGLTRLSFSDGRYPGKLSMHLEPLNLSRLFRSESERCPDRVKGHWTNRDSNPTHGHLVPFLTESFGDQPFRFQSAVLPLSRPEL